MLFVLGEMLFDESQSLKAERRYLRKTTEKQRARDLATEPDFYVDTFAEDWDGTKLLDNVLIDADAGKMRDLIRREVHPITGTFPLRIAVTNERLGTLAPIIRQMESEFEISFVIERIFCNEEQLIAFAAADL